MVTLIRYYNNLYDRALADYQVRPLISLNRLQIHNGIWYNKLINCIVHSVSSLCVVFREGGVYWTGGVC